MPRHISRTSTKPLVTVITLSSRGAKVLRGAIDTVRAQDYRGPIDMLVVGDNARWNLDSFRGLSRRGFRIRCFSIRTDSAFRSLAPVERVSRLRNIGLTLVEGAFFAFLDDDNRWESSHVSSLVDVSQKNQGTAAHSWRQLFDQAGKPWVADRFPWRCDADRARGLFQRFTRAGMLSTSDNIFRDAAVATVDGDDVGAVDMGAWLFPRELIGQVQFETSYSTWDLRNSITEDDKLLGRLKQLRVPIVSTRAATLKYYFGGYSNFNGARNSIRS